MLSNKVNKEQRHRKAFYHKENHPQMHNINRQVNPIKVSSTKALHQTSKPLDEHCHNSPTVAYLATYDPHLPPTVLTSPGCFLSKHAITASMRACMVDWLIEASTCFSLSHQTYFSAIGIMDQYMGLEKRKLLPAQLHCVGVVALILASKIWEVHPISLDNGYQQLGHRKITRKELLEAECRVLEVLSWEKVGGGCWEVAMTKLAGWMSRRLKEQRIKEVESFAAMLCQTAVIDYESYAKWTPAVVGEAVCKAVVEMFGRGTVDALMESCSSAILVQMTKQHIIDNALSLRSRYPHLKNIQHIEKVISLKYLDKNLRILTLN